MVKKQFFFFCVVGGFGFFVDAGIFKLSNWLVSNYYVARLISYLCAATFTWYFNRKFTFGSRVITGNRIILEWLSFLYTQGYGFIVNYGVFSILVYYSSFFKQYPVLAIAAATIPSLFINFISAKLIVFKNN